eukprot:Skav203327  [mRNA]  locus=scaffold284:237697:238446:+ [translate_table: standard]
MELMNQGGDLTDLLDHESPSPRHIPVCRNRSRTPPRSLENVRPEVVAPSCGSKGSVQDIIDQKFKELEKTLISTVKEQIAQFMAAATQSQLPESAQVKDPTLALETSNLVHDLQVIRSDSDILAAIDKFWKLMSDIRCSGRANLVVTFCPQPPIASALALNQRFEAMGITVVSKGQRCDKLPWGSMGGQKGQPCLCVQMKDGTKFTAQLQCRLGNMVVKGRRSAFSPDLVRKIIPFLGGPVAVAATSQV